jgi:hypothetical protein
MATRKGPTSAPVWATVTAMILGAAVAVDGGAAMRHAT